MPNTVARSTEKWPRLRASPATAPADFARPARAGDQRRVSTTAVRRGTQAWPFRQPTGQPTRQAEEEATPQPEEQGPAGHCPPARRPPRPGPRSAPAAARSPGPPAPRWTPSPGPARPRPGDPPRASPGCLCGRCARTAARTIRFCGPRSRCIAEEPRDGRRREAVDETVEEWPREPAAASTGEDESPGGLPTRAPTAPTRAPRPSPKASRSVSVYHRRTAWASHSGCSRSR